MYICHVILLCSAAVQLSAERWFGQQWNYYSLVAALCSG